MQYAKTASSWANLALFTWQFLAGLLHMHVNLAQPCQLTPGNVALLWLEKDNGSLFQPLYESVDTCHRWINVQFNVCKKPKMMTSYLVSFDRSDNIIVQNTCPLNIQGIEFAKVKQPAIDQIKPVEIKCDKR